MGECPLCHAKIPGAENTPGADPAGESSPEKPGFTPPDLVVPFSMEKEFFIQKFRERLRNLELPPDSFLKASIESVRAFYVPVFLYDAEVTGEMSFHGEALTEAAAGGGSRCKAEEFETEAAGSQLYSGSPEIITGEFSDEAFRNLEPFDSQGGAGPGARFMPLSRISRFRLSSKGIISGTPGCALRPPLSIFWQTGSPIADSAR